MSTKTWKDVWKGELRLLKGRLIKWAGKCSGKESWFLQGLHEEFYGKLQVKHGS